MTKRTDARNISLGPDHAEREAALRALADALDLDGNLSAVVRFVADIAIGDMPGLVVLLEAAQDRAGGGDEMEHTGDSEKPVAADSTGG